MSRRITIVLGGSTTDHQCGNCPFLFMARDEPRCGVFVVNLDPAPNVAWRCLECRGAEEPQS